jgi:hypothetical protein
VILKIKILGKVGLTVPILPCGKNFRWADRRSTRSSIVKRAWRNVEVPRHAAYLTTPGVLEWWLETPKGEFPVDVVPIPSTAGREFRIVRVRKDKR